MKPGLRELEAAFRGRCDVARAFMPGRAADLAEPESRTTMRYLTPADLLTLRGAQEIHRLAGSAGETAITAAINQAEAEATSYLLARYRNTLPTNPSTTPPVLKAKIAALAHRRLLAGGQPSPALETESQQALSWLRDVARGAASLDLPSAPPADDASPAVAAITPTGPGLRLQDLHDW